MSITSARDLTQALPDYSATNTAPAPSGVLTWGSPTQRNRLLAQWRRAVCTAFAEQPRVLRVAWALFTLFNAKTGYAHPSNTCLAKETGLFVRKVQEALEALEEGGAIIKAGNSTPGRKGLRLIYPATGILGGTTTVVVGGYDQQAVVQNLIRTTPLRVPRSQMEFARRQALVRDGYILGGRDLLLNDTAPDSAETAAPTQDDSKQHPLVAKLERHLSTNGSGR